VWFNRRGRGRKDRLCGAEEVGREGGRDRRYVHKTARGLAVEIEVKFCILTFRVLRNCSLFYTSFEVRWLLRGLICSFHVRLELAACWTHKIQLSDDLTIFNARLTPFSKALQLSLVAGYTVLT
jgi:hypothetical protein